MYQPEKLKARRKELKLTQKDIANKLGISYQAYSAWERGVKEPSTEKVALLEKLLKVPKGYFTEIEIVRLYNVLSPNGKEQVVSYARDLVVEEQNKKVVSITEPRYEYRVYEEMSAGLGATIYGEKEYDTVWRQSGAEKVFPHRLRCRHPQRPGRARGQKRRPEIRV